MGGNFWNSSHCNYWLLDKHEVALTRHDLDKNGLTENDLKLMQIFTAELAQVLGLKLKLRQQIIATAIVFVRRFYARNSYGACHPLLLVPTAMYLAMKVEEWGMPQAKSIITAAYSMVRQEFKYVYGEFDKFFPVDVKQITDCEYYLLEELNCYMIVYHPYRPLLQFFNDSNIKDKELLQTAWHILNASYRTDLCLIYPPYLIALAAVQMAGVIQDKDKRQDIKQWLAELTVDMNEVLEIQRILLEMYQLWETYNEQSVCALVSKMPKPTPAASGQ